ncbi:iron-sulfur cluster assembly scaffold protein [Adlercreutzia sp. R25]|uniref:Iron-sulfur cluster assembly scaffold protein n=1 Tax=Adlercreutzia shanghongiae TaxID=3111773 RepID=A0ABU6IXH7_9ACTN|nr:MULTISPECIES: iron-sulfur cluster assembly scaffold protein [unclassified Adlercreutzia]MEC4272541.1 iron-sulfur cluster assembly scaffold protein [Adlercreutzia sp. R25]MEC4294559.1 iron-sulfur cluster assembly scaffold protein [Adlercreutzia sp. R22]
MPTTIDSALIEERSRSTAHRGLSEGAFARAGRRVLEAKGDNPFCGDEIEVRITCAADEKGDMLIEQARFDGYACNLCLASADVLMERVEGMTAAQAASLGFEDLCRWLGGLTVGRTRKGCVELPLNVLARALAQRVH